MNVLDNSSYQFRMIWSNSSPPSKKKIISKSSECPRKQTCLCLFWDFLAFSGYFHLLILYNLILSLGLELVTDHWYTSLPINIAQEASGGSDIFNFLPFFLWSSLSHSQKIPWIFLIGPEERLRWLEKFGLCSRNLFLLIYSPFPIYFFLSHFPFRNLKHEIFFVLNFFVS